MIGHILSGSEYQNKHFFSWNAWLKMKRKCASKELMVALRR